MVAPILDSPEISGDYRGCTPLPRLGEVEDIANTAVFLLSDAAELHHRVRSSTSTAGTAAARTRHSAMLEPVFGADGLRGVV